MKKWIALIIFLLIILITASSVIYINAREPMKDARGYAEHIAKTKAKIVTVDEFYLYNGSSTYYVVTGERENGKKIIVWVPEDKKETVIVKNMADGISKDQAKAKLMKEENPKKILRVRLGMEKKLPVWELSYLDDRSKLNYYYIHFESGKWWRKIENL